jgi:hypothetical protein
MSENIKVGLTGWGDKNQTGPREDREELPRLPFMRLQNGNNVLRIITDPYVYYHIRYKGSKSKGSFGDRVNTAWPTHKEDCPAYNFICKPNKTNPKKRYFVAVVDRRDNEVKIFDMSVLVYEQLQGILADLKEATSEDHAPTDFDINIRYNSKASSPSGFYHVMGRPVAALSEADVELINGIGSDVITKILDRQSASPRPDQVQRRLESLGWSPDESSTEEEEASEDLEGAKEDDYSFDKPDKSAEASAAN